jgi:2'-5' RNA ligase
MRLFVALDIDEEIRSRIQEFTEQVRSLAPHVRWVAPSSLHITLKFIGEKPEAFVQQIESALKSVTVAPFRVEFSGAGFFSTSKAARVFWIGIEAERGLAELASKVEDSLATLAIPKEQRASHLTLARASNASGAPGWRKGDKPNQQFAGLQEHLAKSPVRSFGTMTAREFFLYRSKLSSKGSTYTKIACFQLS